MIHQFLHNKMLFGNSSDEDLIYEHALDKLFNISCIFVIVSAVIFGFLLSKLGIFFIIVNISLFSIGLFSLLTSIGGYRLTSALFFIGSLYLFYAFLCATFDIPAGNAPRTLHFFFLVVGVGGFIRLNHEPTIRLFVLIFCFITFLFFQDTGWGLLNTSYNMSNYIHSVPARIHLGWIFSGVAFSSLIMLFYFDKYISENTSLKKTELLEAISKNQFELYYQPQSSHQHIIGAEALIRWNHPKKGVLTPNHFIPQIEKLDLMLTLSHWVLRRACKQLAIWSRNPLTKNLSLAVNVCAQDFTDQDYVKNVISIIDQESANPHLLKLELTESVLISNMETTIIKMKMLRSYGVRISLDDFGTGYSSLNYLKKLPLDQLKIDQSFIREIASNRHDQAIARTVIELAKSLDLDVIAEGVETDSQFQYLLSIGCNKIQGYLLSHPLPIRDFNDFLIKSC